MTKRYLSIKSLCRFLSSPAFIPSVLSEPEGFLADWNQLRTRRIESAFLSVLVHASLILLAILLVHKSNAPLPAAEGLVFIDTPFFNLPGEGDGSGGGGGGGGRREQAPPAWGGMPNGVRSQLLPPDPEEPQPLIPSDDVMPIPASVVMPIEIAGDQSLPIGDLSAPFSKSRSSGPGNGDGIGDGDGTGIGPGKGPGYGEGKNGGYGNGIEGTIGSGGNGIYGPGVAGLHPPELLYDPKPEYTEAARKARIEGIVLIQAIIRKDGSIDGFRIIRGLGGGLDESAIRTIGAKWRFKPGRLNGVPVDVLVKIEVSFRLF
jgi:protein TonB